MADIWILKRMMEDLSVPLNFAGGFFFHCPKKVKFVGSKKNHRLFYTLSQLADH